MAVLVTDLVEAVRQRSGLRNNQFYTDTDIMALLTLANQELRDEIQKANEHHLMIPFDFTLAGGIDDCSVSLPDDFIQGHSVDLNPDQTNRVTIHYLDNWLQRNDTRYRFRPRYFFRAGELVMYPPEQCAGDYRLWYTPIGDKFQLPITVEFDMEDDDSPAVPPVGILAGTGSWAFENSALNHLIPVDGSVNLVLTFTATNLTFSGPYPIVDIGLETDTPSYGRPTAGVSNLASIAGFTFPVAGSGTYTYQAIGTVDELDPVVSAYSLFHILHASIAVRTGREQDVSDLKMELDGEHGYRKRVQASVQNRAEEPIQPPLRNRAGSLFEEDFIGNE